MVVDSYWLCTWIFYVNVIFFTPDVPYVIRDQWLVPHNFGGSSSFYDVRISSLSGCGV